MWSPRYVSPEPQRVVRLEVAQLLFSGMTAHADARFVWAEWPVDKLLSSLKGLGLRV